MKKINLLQMLAIIIVATIGITSCSSEQNTQDPNESSNIAARTSSTNPKVITLKAAYGNIVRTKEYEDYKFTVKEFGLGLNGNLSAPITNRNNFQSWISANISHTNFSDVPRAMYLYDKALSTAAIYYSMHASFYDELEDLSPTEVREILLPELAEPVQVTTLNECSEDCGDEVIANMDFLDEGQAEYMATHDDFTDRFYAETMYWNTVEYIIDSYNNCLANCTD